MGIVANVRYLAAQLSDRQRLALRVIWPAWVAGVLAIFITVSYRLGGTGWALGMAIACMALDLLALWRLRPLLADFRRRVDNLHE